MIVPFTSVHSLTSVQCRERGTRLWKNGCHLSWSSSEDSVFTSANSLHILCVCDTLRVVCEVVCVWM